MVKRKIIFKKCIVFTEDIKSIKKISHHICTNTLSFYKFIYLKIQRLPCEKTIEKQQLFVHVNKDYLTLQIE